MCWCNFRCEEPAYFWVTRKIFKTQRKAAPCFCSFSGLMWIFSMWRCFKCMTKNTIVFQSKCSVFHVRFYLPEKYQRSVHPHINQTCLYTIHRTNMGILKAHHLTRKFLDSWRWGCPTSGDPHNLPFILFPIIPTNLRSLRNDTVTGTYQNHHLTAVKTQNSYGFMKFWVMTLDIQIPGEEMFEPQNISWEGF